jgi:hypothetical protein
MSKLLIPIHLDAKVVVAPQAVPALDGPAFNQTSQLEAGVHLHWALPDALARARNVELQGGQACVFPAVPDLWLIVRFQPIAPAAAPAPVQPAQTNPGIRTQRTIGTTPLRPSIGPVIQRAPVIDLGPKIEINPKQPPIGIFSARREWKAWVLDSRTGAVTPLEQWTPPASRAAGRLTVVGELPDADAIGMPGWARWDAAKGDPQIYGAGYYPHSRKRFGFHDPAADVPANAEIGYAVIGWYADRNHDPLYRSDDRSGLLDRWNMAYEQPAGRSSLLTPAIADVTSTWVAPSLAQAGAGQVVQTASQRMRQVDTLIGKRSTLMQIDDKLAQRLPTFELRGPSEIVCHGAVVKVPRTPPAASASQSWNVGLSPSIKRAAAELASKGNGDVVSTEALLQDLEGQARTIGGFLDVPAALHALTFQTAPGASRWSAEIRLRAKSGQAGKRPSKTTMFDRNQLGAVDRMIKATPTARLVSNSGYPGLSRDLGKLIDIANQGPMKPAPSPGPTDAQIAAALPNFTTQLRAAFAQTKTKAAAIGKPIHPRWVKVTDTRRDAPASSLAGLRGSASAGWWLDIDDDAHVRVLLIASWNALLDQPDATRLHEQPGPRWFRPSVPHLTIEGVDRAYRWGFDGRYEYDGKLACRLAGSTITANRVTPPGVQNSPAVPGSALIDRGNALSSDAGLPSVARSLIEEVMLLDPGNATLLAKNWRHRYTGPNEPSEAEVSSAYEACNMGWALLRQPDLAPADEETWRAAIGLVGTWPSPIAVGPWTDPWLPLFVDAKYSHMPASLAQQYQLGEIELEAPAGAYPSAGATVQHSERCFLTSAVSKVVEGATITNLAIDKFGNPIPVGEIDLSPDTFERYDMLSAALGQIDDRLRAAGQHERSGRVRIDEIAIVDAFGTRRSWTAPNSNVTDPRHLQAPPWLIGASPRLPHWARLMCRFMAADKPGTEAEPGVTPVCGFMLPDFVEHALELFDGQGKAIGQLVSDPPIRGKQGPKTLKVRFVPHPWLGHQGAPLDAIANAYLREVVAGIVAQSQVVPAGAPAEQLFESGLTALLRAFDTAAGTVAWDGLHGERNIRLFGKPIAIVRTKLWLETSGAATPGSDPQQHPPIPVQVGAISRPEDGVYGVFLPGAQPSASRFAPVSREVIDNAVINGLRDSIYGSIGVAKLDHPFVADPAVGPSRFTLAPNQQREFSLFVEVGGAVTLTCGVLPRKKLTLDPWFTDPAVRHMEPTLAVGPVLAVPGLDGRPVPLLPHPDVPGHEEWWLERPTGDGAWEVQTIAALPSTGAVPRTRAVLTEGWIRLEPSEPS